MRLPTAVPGLVVARLLARRPPLCHLVGAAVRRVLMQTIEEWLAEAAQARVAVMRDPRRRPTRGDCGPPQRLHSTH